jgi:hypothetical protein
MTKEELLAEVDDILRMIPSKDSFDQRTVESASWVGRAAAVVERWDRARSTQVMVVVHDINKPLDMVSNVRGRTGLTSLLHQARAALRLDIGPLSVAFDKGQVFDYFDELRKLIETARKEVFFIDPYLDAEFVSRYLPPAAAGVGARLLAASKQMATLLPAVDLYAKQSGMTIRVRSTNAIHDRYVFVDGTVGFISGASFKDGARKAPAVLTQVLDPFQATWDMYNGLWAKAQVER